ncbi:MAG: ABC transporter permease [Spirochaetes bacterium]|nr:ABC transporter permease [Spirochaetota bacterium]
MEEIINYIEKSQEIIIQAIGQHFFLFTVSMVFTLMIGFILSLIIINTKNQKIAQGILTMTAAAQSVPSAAVIAIVFLFIGIGVKPAIIALVLYSLVPIIFNTTSGLVSIHPKLIEAGRGMGLTNNQILWKIKIPIAMPVIMAGIRSAATINIGTATVAAIIGGGGLGDLIFMGLKLRRNHVIIIAALLTSIIAIIIDTILYFLEQKVTPKGLKVKI